MKTALALAERPTLVRQDEARAPALRDLGGRYREGGEIFLFDEISDTGRSATRRPRPPQVARQPGQR